MTTDLVTRQAAAEIFVQRVILRAYDGVIDDVTEDLEKGPSGTSPSPNKVALHQWFQGMDDQSQKNVKAIVEDAVHASVFGSLVVLDNVVYGYALERRLSDFALYLQTYQDVKAKAANLAQESVRVNSRGVELHDLFQFILRDRKMNKP